MRKTSTYARKRRNAVIDTGAWVSAVQRCRPYAADSIEYMGIADTMASATTSMLRVREAYISIKQRNTQPGNTNDFDLLTHAMAVSTIRAIQIAGADADSNAMLQIIKPANDALRRMLERRRATGVWGFDGPGLIDVADALDVYETIITSGTPGDMLSAIDIYSAAKSGCVVESLEVVAT